MHSTLPSGADCRSSEENVRRALRDGPYGRCVYRCDNDVVDHQVVNLRFAHQQTVTFTMTAFTKMEDRKRACLAPEVIWKVMASKSGCLIS